MKNQKLKSKIISKKSFLLKLCPEFSSKISGLFIVFSISLFLIFGFFLPNFSALSQLSPEQERQILEEELKELEDKIAQYEQDITKTQQEKNTLQNQVSILKNKIQKLNLQIQQSNLIIKDMSLQLEDTGKSIENTSLKIEDYRGRLADILRMIYEEDQKSGVEIILSSDGLSDFFNNLTALENLNIKSKEMLENIKDLKVNLEGQKQSLDEEKEDLERITKIQTLQREESVATKNEQEKLLEKTKGKESEYQKILSETKQRAAEIRSRIFELTGVPKAPTFGEAYEIAKYVSGITGVRPAFLLAILQQESAIGKNVGQCYLKDMVTGKGIRINTGQELSRIMSPKRDIPPFLIITKDLGRDPLLTQVSCPMSFGWGGAMGPAQFIPSTWMLYKDRLGGIIGKAADPWDIKDAFLAAGVYLSDYGAKSKTKDGEWKAAMIYFSGSTTNSAFYWYANNVLKIADGFEKDIAVLEATK